MLRRRPALRNRRGITTTELVIAATVSLWITFLVTGYTHFQLAVWTENNADFSNQKSAQVAMQEMTPFLRAARSVVTASSSSSCVTLQMPSYDTSGNLIVPLTNGDIIAFYLGDSSGNASSTGTILWRSVNGTPDTTWSAPNGHARVTLGAGGLSFTYPDSSPESVAVTVTATSIAGSTTRQVSTTQEVILRNWGL